jgi:hypothetical protein
MSEVFSTETKFTPDDLLRAKRATVVLAECFKAAMGGKQAPLELRKDMLALTKALRVLEPTICGGSSNEGE